jgi:hypothetical protein
LACVKIHIELGNFFNIKKGLKQGDGLAPLLFNFTSEHVIRQLYIDTRRMFEEKFSTNADDIHLMCRSLRAAKEVFEDLNTDGRKVGQKQMF